MDGKSFFEIDAAKFEEQNVVNGPVISLFRVSFRHQETCTTYRTSVLMFVELDDAQFVLVGQSEFHIDLRVLFLVRIEELFHENDLTIDATRVDAQTVDQYTLQLVRVGNVPAFDVGHEVFVYWLGRLTIDNVVD